MRVLDPASNNATKSAPNATAAPVNNNGGMASPTPDGISLASLPGSGSVLSLASTSAYTAKANNTTERQSQQQQKQQLVAPLVLHSQHLLKPNGSILGKDVAAAVLPRFPDLLAALDFDFHQDAVASVDGRSAISHAQIRSFLQKMGQTLHALNIGRGHRVAVVLPNGPELALAILVVTCWASCVPLNAFGAAQELEADLVNSAADIVIGRQDNPAIRLLAHKCGLPFVGLVPDAQQAGLFTLVVPPAAASDNTAVVGIHATYKPPKRFQPQRHYDLTTNNPHHPNYCFAPNQHADEVLVLFTSGTTGSKKLVPHLLADILVASACIAVSWKLTPADTNCNLMPLFHVGGIIRQVFSPVLSGGCVICCPAFDPALFWQLLTGGCGSTSDHDSNTDDCHQTRPPAFTWYYSAPTMHQLILQTGRAEGYIEPVDHIANGHNLTPRLRPKHANIQLRMIANAAGGLLPSLARELRQAFGANVLPSYGMTECMPISSPPATYELEKPGTSGVAVGPEVAILNLETQQALQAGKEGPICVRAEPCFRGYGALFGGHRTEQPQTFLPGGWFNTGDLGYMDADGYLYITGRSKEVINRGGEIISPMEVEEAITGHPAVQACVAFSTQHAVLQEVVGLLLVPVAGKPRLDLPALHEYLGQGRLAAPKWPQCLVYMDNGIPKSHTNKLLRVKLGQRLSLPEMNDSMNAIERTFQAACPPVGTPVSVAIPCERVSVSPEHVQAVLQQALVDPAQHPAQDVIVVPHPTKLGGLVAHVLGVNRLSVVQTAREQLDAYLVPGHVCELSGPFTCLTDLSPPQPSDAVASILREESTRGAGPTDSLVMELQELVQVLLDLDCLPSPETSFFNLGGSSMLASQFASRIRKLHNVPFGGAEVFHHPSCNDIAGIIRERRGDGTGAGADANSMSTATNPVDPASLAASSLFSKQLDLSRTPFDQTRLEPEGGFWANLFQLFPLFFVYPVWQLTRFFLFFRCLLWVMDVAPGDYNLLNFVFTLVVFHFFWITITPLLFVLIKWTVIGKYQKGRYAIWGGYYLRWWFVDVMRKLIGRGLWGSNYLFLNAYYRMLGANIGKDARISLEADLAEYDLVTVGDEAAIEYSTVRGFGVDNGCITLGPVYVGHHSSVGARSVVAPYTEIPDGMHLGPVTSSYETKSASLANTNHLGYNRQALPEPYLLSQIFIVGPITFVVSTLSHMPALAVLYWMLKKDWHHDEPFATLGDLMEWLCDARRIPFYVGVRVARAIIAPFVYTGAAIVVKKLIIGKFREGPREKTEWELIRHQLVSTLFSRENMQDITELLGRHYELISIMYRMLGAKIGKRVFWPGHQPVFSGEFDLLEIGDDVVFGSRASIFCTTVDSYKKVVLCAGSNVSDNTVVLPGSVIGKNAVLGSNSLCPMDRYLPEQSVWFGARSGEPVLLEKGPEGYVGPTHSSEISTEQMQMEGDDTTIRPFGRALYEGEATYFVMPIWMMIAFTMLTRIFIATLHTLPMLSALQLGACYFYGWDFPAREYDAVNVPTSSMYVVLLAYFLFTHFVSVVVWFQIEVLSKWGLLGERKEGRYNYDTSNYCQTWELYQILNRVRFNGRMNTMDFLSGTPYMTAFFRSLGLKTGKDCCLYPAGGDPYMPEPDLVEMGDHCVVDCSSIVCHLNTRGNFELAKIKMENNVTLRTRSRIQQGVHMEANSMLLEKALAMTGEIIEGDSIWVGAPACRLMSYDTSSIDTSALSYNGSQTGSSAIIV